MAGAGSPQGGARGSPSGSHRGAHAPAPEPGAALPAAGRATGGGLNDEHHRTEAAEIIRGLIYRIELTPKEEDGARMLSIELHGALASILAAGHERREAAAEQRPLGSGNKAGCGGTLRSFPTGRLRADAVGCVGPALSVNTFPSPWRPIVARSGLARAGGRWRGRGQPSYRTQRSNPFRSANYQCCAVSPAAASRLELSETHGFSAAGC